MHDHAQSERDRKEYEYREALRERNLVRQEVLVLEGALHRIANGTNVDARQVAGDALAVITRLRK